MKKLLYVIGIVVVFIIGVSLGHRLSTIETERSCQAVIETQKNIEASRSRGMQKAQFDRGYWMGVSDDKQCQQLHFQDACDRVNGKADRGFEQ